MRRWRSHQPVTSLLDQRHLKAALRARMIASSTCAPVLLWSSIHVNIKCFARLAPRDTWPGRASAPPAGSSSSLLCDGGQQTPQGLCWSCLWQQAWPINQPAQQFCSSHRRACPGPLPSCQDKCSANELAFGLLDAACLSAGWPDPSSAMTCLLWNLALHMLRD